MPCLLYLLVIILFYFIMALDLRLNQWRHQDLVPGGAHAKVAGFLQEATVDI